MPSDAAVEDLEALSRPFAERRMDRGIRAALSGRELKDFESASRESEKQRHAVRVREGTNKCRK